MNDLNYYVIDMKYRYAKMKKKKCVWCFEKGVKRGVSTWQVRLQKRQHSHQQRRQQTCTHVSRVRFISRKREDGLDEKPTLPLEVVFSDSQCHERPGRIFKPFSTRHSAGISRLFSLMHIIFESVCASCHIHRYLTSRRSFLNLFFSSSAPSLARLASCKLVDSRFSLLQHATKFPE